MGSIWQLFVDETGSFPEDSVVAVVGVLVRAYDTPQLKLQLRRRFEQAYPLVDYPPHATVLNLAASRAAYAWPPLPDPAPAGAEVVVERTRACIALLQASGDAVPTRFREEARRRPVQFETARPANRWLATTAPAELARVQQLVTEQSADFARALTETLDHLGGGRDVGSERAFAAAAVSTAVGPSAPDRYSRCLTALLGVVAGALPAGSQVWVRVARPRFGDWQLNRDRLRRVVEHAPADGVRFVDFPPVAYDADVHPGVVVADFAANRLGTVLMRRPGSVEALLEAFEVRAGLRLRGPAPGGVTLAVLGGRTDAAPWVVAEGGPA